MSNNTIRALSKLQRIDNTTLLKQYHSKAHTFALITSVLNGTQEGSVYSDGKHNNYFVIHKFGFADLMEAEESSEFDASLYAFFKEKSFLQNKIHWYNLPNKWVTLFGKNKDKMVGLAERAQLILESLDTIHDTSTDYSLITEQITESNYDLVETSFNLSLGSRFWSSKQQFLNHSLGIVVYKDNEPAALCYACAIADGVAEVDIFTKESFRTQGLAKLATAKFINLCLTRKLKVHWDCYTNNKPSYSLAQSFGFHPYHIYPHAIISK